MRARMKRARAASRSTTNGCPVSLNFSNGDSSSAPPGADHRNRGGYFIILRGRDRNRYVAQLQPLAGRAWSSAELRYKTMMTQMSASPA